MPDNIAAPQPGADVGTLLDGGGTGQPAMPAMGSNDLGSQLDPDGNKLSYEDLAKQNATLNKRYDESSKEGKRLAAVAKEQDTRIQELEKATQRLTQLKPFLDYMDSETQTQQPESNPFEDADLSDFGNPNSEVFKAFAGMIGNVAGQVVKQELGKYDQTTTAKQTEDKRRQNFIAQHKGMDPNKLDEILNWAQKRGAEELYNDLYVVYQHHNKPAEPAAGNPAQPGPGVIDAPNPLAGLPQSLAGDGTTAGAKTAADNMFNRLSRIMNTKDLGSMVSPA